ncbi:MAG: hypothetical protein FWD89_01365 [Firmicutes bacterium]|nr:hypothetical protein [Bacillota bacterium]MCL2770940.1 hypothetical protein [Bacillota bacterium]
MVTLFWKIKKLIGFVMFAAALMALISFFMNIGVLAELFSGVEDFNGAAAGIATIIEMAGTPLILFTLGLLVLFLPRPSSN